LTLNKHRGLTKRNIDLVAAALFGTASQCKHDSDRAQITCQIITHWRKYQLGLPRANRFSIGMTDTRDSLCDLLPAGTVFERPATPKTAH